MDSKPDMEQRDPKNLNVHVQVQFEEVLGEPEGVRSIDCVWRNGYKCFNCTLSCCYVTLSVLCGIPMAFCWGCKFACLAFYHVWCYTPMVRLCTINLTAARKLYTLILDVCCGTLCETCGLFFSRIVVKNG